ncbi:hypothetical protein JCM10207_000062 [Rhodosporidiobolus poonsookiae]
MDMDSNSTMDMGDDMSSMPVDFGSLDPCYLGWHNGTYPDGTLGAGMWMFGRYMPTDGEMAPCSAQDSWYDGWKYALWTTYFLVAYFGLAGLVNAFNRLDTLSRTASIRSPFILPPRVKALLRAIDQPRASRWLPPLGMSLLYAAFTAFTFAFVWGIRPYYRPPNYGSPPLAIRSEMVSTALVVWIFACGVKRNALAYLTGLSYPRMINMHKAFAWACLFFALIHTVAFMVVAFRQAPWSYTFSVHDKYYGWPAWTALCSLFWLCALSLGPIRRRAHDLWYTMHVLASLIFIVGMYYHIDQLLNTWRYMHASVVILGTAMLYRFGVVGWLTRGFTRAETARIELVEDDALSMTIDLKGPMTWAPGQHVFVRFLTLFPWQTHPFSITSLDVPHPSTGKRTLRFLLRPYNGLTARLFARAVASASKSFALPVFLDGPYGPSSVAELTHAADHVVLIAGGSGMSFVAPLIGALTRPLGFGGELHVVRSLEVVWAVPRDECVEWFRPELDEALAVAARLGEKGLDADERAAMGLDRLVSVDVRVCVTRDGHLSVGGDGSGKGKEGDSDAGRESRVKTQVGRPAVDEIIASVVQTKAGRVTVVACGPPSLLLAARNACARAQRELVLGRVPKGGATEVVLHEETYEC